MALLEGANADCCNQEPALHLQRPATVLCHCEPRKPASGDNKNSPGPKTLSPATGDSIVEVENTISPPAKFCNPRRHFGVRGQGSRGSVASFEKTPLPT
ncbi:uncharacterized protein CLUP02_15449 [Colletotrichum lupini]|uniref:Uncharacterized protein n=1 Tax=Colletotrichum lupini TaxID=145971 RepID=A0A9Q8WNA5_9PEZI|nr:uncharacterized protein CLUP02_15449 [Colletotrichum lupini]UQC89918.1 hypothetical protein CLUP02_15449 [Colletotrichum lupini]